MALDIVNTVLGLSSTSWILLFVIFILFVLAMKKVFRIVMNAVWIVLAAFLFPIFANRVLGLAVPTDMDSILLLAVAGLGAYFVYLVVKSIYSLFSLASKIGKRVVPKIEIGGKNKGGAKSESGHEENNKIKLQKMEKPKLGEPLPKNFFSKGGKSEKELFKNYVMLEDVVMPAERDFAPKISVKAKERQDDYVKLEPVGRKKERGVEEVEVEKEEYVDLAAAKGAKIEKIREIKHRKKRKK